MGYLASKMRFDLYEGGIPDIGSFLAGTKKSTCACLLSDFNWPDAPAASSPSTEFSLRPHGSASCHNINIRATNAKVVAI